jgi:hypothetical protein
MTKVHQDETRGHFVLELDPHGNFAREVVGADLGSTIHITTRSAHLSADEARMLAEVLTWWADRKHDRPDDHERVVEINDLLDLLEESA